MSKLRVAMTGATGLLGRNLLFEFLKQHFNDLDSLEIFILGRSKSDNSIEQRIKSIVLSDGVEYIAISDNEQIEKLKRYCNSGIHYIDIDLNENKLDIKQDDFKKLKVAPIDFFFHIAALTDFRDTPGVAEALKRTNVYGTKQTLQLVSVLKVNEFCYVGSAYSCGSASGVIPPDYIDFNQKFRNPYELTKLEAEILVREFAKKTGTKCRFFRPSTICGRLIEKPFGAVSKFDVFYAWGAFFLRIKLKKTGAIKYDDTISMDMRVCYSLKSGLNIVPSDYAAKVLYQVCLQNATGESFYLTNSHETPHHCYIPCMSRIINIGGMKHVDDIPEDMNEMERFYYKTVGKIFTPYVTSEPMLFDIGNTKDLLVRANNIACPPVDEKNFCIIYEYAKKYNFGINPKPHKL